ncbi:hypothetical protein BGZ73_005285 [Actinomortierella ambigua]|nr:hypothetical protein BGZ73_005285 [Actinomortierella ambigua]
MKPCPLCSGEVSSFSIADDVTVEMCNNQECIYPFNEDPSDFELLVDDNRPTKSLGKTEDSKRKHGSADASIEKKRKKRKTAKKGAAEATASASPSAATDILFGPTPASSTLTSPQIPDLTFDILSHDSTWTTPVTPPDTAPTTSHEGAKNLQQPFMDMSASGIESLLFGDDPLLGLGSFDNPTMQLLEHDATFDAILQG